MSLLSAIRETVSGFKSLVTGMRITLKQAAQPNITVQYPHETLKMPDRFRGHIKLVLDPDTGKSRCTACNLCVKACPSECISLTGIKREGEKKKSISEYNLDFTKCSLCGECVEVCPSDAITFSKEYNVVARNREEFANMDLLKRMEGEAQVWKLAHPQPPAPEAPPPSAAPAPAPASPAAPAPAAVAAALAPQAPKTA
jgi:NADH-quinone oxidoreductase chain I